MAKVVPNAMAKANKKFKDTTLGKILIGAASVINPSLGALLSGAANVSDAVRGIVEDGTLTAEQRENLKNLAHELEIQEFELEVKDRESARAREVGVLKAGGQDVMFKIVGIGILLIWGILLYGVFFSGMNLGENRELALIGFGGITTYVGHIVSYYFGSSIGSKEKTKMLG